MTGRSIFDLRPAGDRQGPDRGAARVRRAAAVRGRRRVESTTSRATARAAHRRSPTTVSGTTLECDVIAGCDGFHGICRPADPGRRAHDATSASTRSPGSASWPRSRPSTDELIYAHHPNGFALHSMRSPNVSRLYLQVPPDEQIDDWSDERIWAELRHALRARGLGAEAGAADREGHHADALVRRPSRCAAARLYLAGDAAHIVPPTGAKGLNLAAQDVQLLADRAGRVVRERVEPPSSTPTRTMRCAASGACRTSRTT